MSRQRVRPFRSHRSHRSHLAAVVAVVALAVTSGCWLQIGAGAGHSRYNPVEQTLTAASVTGLAEQWSVELNGNGSEPMIWQGRVFVTWTNAGSGGVQAFALADGSPLWSTPLISGIGGDGSVVGGTAVTVMDGRLWSGHLGLAQGAPGHPEPICAAGIDILDPATGGRVGGNTGGFPSPLASTDGIVARTLLRLSASCAPSIALVVGGAVAEWSANFDLSSGSFLPTLAGGQVFVARNTVLEAYAAAGCGAATCPPTWSQTFPSRASDAMAGTTGPVYVTTGGNLLALDRTTGLELWRMPLGPAGDESSGGMALAEGTVYAVAGTASGPPSLLAIDAAGCGAATCSPDWTAALPGTGLRPPAVGGDVVYTSTSTGVHAFDAAGCGAATCSPLTSIALPAGGTVSVAQGHVLVASGTRLTALGLG